MHGFRASGAYHWIALPNTVRHPRAGTNLSLARGAFSHVAPGKKTAPMTRSTLALSILILTATACDQPDDGTDASTNAASSTSDTDTTGPDVLAASTSTSDADASSTSDEGSGGFGGSGGEVCDCALDQVCATHPVTHAWMCVAPCGPTLVCDPVGALEYECVTVGGLGLCFPV